MLATDVATWSLVRALAIVAAIPAVAGAQAGGATDPQFTFGQVGFSPAVIFSVGYDSNLNREPGAFTRGSEFFVIPQLHGWWRLRRLEVTGTTAAEYIRAEDVEANVALTGAPRLNKLVEGAVAYKAPRFTLSSEVSERQTNARPTGFEIGARSVRVERLVTADAILKFGARSDLTARWSRLRTTWDADQIYNGSVLAENLDGRFLTGSLRASIGLTPVTTVFGGIEVMDQQYFLAPIRDNISRNVQGGVGFAPPGLLSGDVVVGYRSATPRAATATDVSGVNVQSNVTYARPTGASLSVVGVSDKQASYDITQGFFRMSGVSVMLRSRTLRGWTAFVNGGFHRLSFSEPAERFETHATYGGGAYVRPRPRLRIGTVVERYDHRARMGQGLAFSGFVFRVYSVYGIAPIQPLDRPLP